MVHLLRKYNYNVHLNSGGEDNFNDDKNYGKEDPNPTWTTFPLVKLEFMFCFLKD